MKVATTKLATRSRPVTPMLSPALLMRCSVGPTCTSQSLLARRFSADVKKTMKAAVVPQYDLEDSDEVHPASLIVRSDWPVPSLHDVESRHDEGDVLVQVAASSVNPIDSMLRRGYGRALLEATAQGRSRLPFIPGFDVAGTFDTEHQRADGGCVSSP
jgi:hypothetical protein